MQRQTRKDSTLKCGGKDILIMHPEEGIEDKAGGRVVPESRVALETAFVTK